MMDLLIHEVTQGLLEVYRFPPTRGAAFCMGLEALAAGFAAFLAAACGAGAFFVDFLASFAALIACSLWAFRTSGF